MPPLASVAMAGALHIAALRSARANTLPFIAEILPQALPAASTSPQVIRGLFTLAWQLRCLSHGVLAILNDRLGQLGRQTTRWPQWFERELG